MRLYTYYFLLRLVKEKRIFLPLSLSFLFMFSINVLRSLSGLSVMVLSFLLLVIGVYCSTNSGAKPNISYLPHPLNPPLLQRRGGGIKKRGVSPLLDTPLC